jgi:hypothetical protein
MFCLSAYQAQKLRELLDQQEDVEQRRINARVASANHLSRRVVYELDIFYSPSDEMQTINVFDEDTQIRDYYIKFVDTQHLGIVPYLLRPVDPTNPRVHLIFRGSKDAPAWCRSTEMPAPGCASFYEERFAILNALQEALALLTSVSIHLIISGHSLGGSDAQTCATEVMQLLMERHKNPANLTEYAALDRINKLTINHASSAGVLLSTARTSQECAEYLTKHKLLDINVMCVFTAGDGVQQTGQSHILANVPDNVAKVELVKLSSQYEGWLSKKYAFATTLTLPFTYSIAVAYVAYSLYAAYKAHAQRFFDNAEFKNQTFKIYNNLTAQGRAKILAKLSKHPLDYSAAHQMIRMLHVLQAYMTHTKRRVAREQQQYVLVDAAECENQDTAVPVTTPPAPTRRCVIS